MDRNKLPGKGEWLKVFPLCPGGTRIPLGKGMTTNSFAEGGTIGLRVSAVKMKGKIAQ